MHSYPMDLLECPACHGSLSWDVSHQEGDRIIEAVARCQGCAAEYPVRDDIGIFLTSDLPRNDLWEQGGQQLSNLLSAHPDIEAQLMNGPLPNLDPVLKDFRNAGWRVAVRNLRSGRALPTPKSRILADQGIDAFPVAETTLDWCVLEAD